MSFSAHQPGRMGSQGRIEFDADAEIEEPLTVSRPFTPDATGSAPALDDLALDDLDEDVFDTADRAVLDGPPAEPELLTDLFTAPADAFVAQPASDEPVAPLSEAPSDNLQLTEPLPVEAATRASRAPRPRRTTGPRRPMRRLAILGGADGVILDQVPTETSRFVQMFFVLLGTAVVSAISMLFALLTGVRVSVWLAIPLAIVWALIIFNLDRFLTSTMKASRSIWKLIGLAIPRVIMAAIIGVVVAEPLVLQVFQNDIAREVTTTNISQSLSDQSSLDSGPEKQALDAATARVAELENQAATGIVAGTSSASASVTAAQADVDHITEQMTAQQTVIDQARELYQCELTGEGAGTVPGCTGVNGQGASSDAAQSQLNQAQATYDALAEQLRAAQDVLATAQDSSKAETAASEQANREQAKASLPAAQASYDAALEAYNNRAAEVASGNSGAVGLLSQISALNRLADREPVLGLAHWLIAALFFLIELLPVLVKVLTSHGDKSLYEQAEEIHKQVETDRITAEGFRARARIATAQSD